MTMHIRDEDLNDYAGGELSAEAMDAVARHLERCGECRHRAEPLLALTARLWALPREAAPAADGWCALHARLVAEERAEAHREAGSATRTAPSGVISLDARRRRAPFAGWVPQAAAAALLLGIGFGGGRLSGSPDGRDAVLVAADTVATAMQTALLVQRAGTDYVAAVAHFVAAARGGDSLAAARGREATFAACYGASRELTRLRPGDSAAVRLQRAAAESRHGSAPPPDTPRVAVVF